MIEDGIESGGVACAVGTMPEEQCLNETDSSFSAEKTFSNVSLFPVRDARTILYMHNGGVTMATF